MICAMCVSKHFIVGIVLLWGCLGLVAHELPFCDGANVAVDPLEARWTFGNHEPLTMYRRVGNRTTGGLEGGALWLADWAADFDAQAPSRMRELGFNWTHSRFFKGLGWNEERKDFPAVRAFVDNCHSNGVRTLAYVQFATLYHEKFKLEVPELAEWASYKADGRHACWHDQYFRWIPCCTSRPFLDYLKRMSEIALKEGRFDGVMFDNVSSQPPCFCERCRRLFREYLKTIEDPKARFGFDSVDGLDAPAAPIAYGEVQDPLVQEWNRWRADQLVAFFRELARHIHAIEPQAVVAGNITDLRRANALGSICLDVPEMASLFDLIMGQSGNVPGVRDGCIVNRVRDLKLATALGCPNLSLCDGDAGIAREDEKHYLLPLLEDVIWGGIPTDRTILTPARGKGHFDEDLIARRRPLLQAFNAFFRKNRRAFASMPYAPVALLYPADGIDVSETNWRGLMSAEEILLRRRIPYRILLSRADVGFELPLGTEVLLVANQKCLSDREVEAVRNWAVRGGKTIVTGASGDSDEWNRQRFANPFDGLDEGRPNVVLRKDPDLCEIPSGAWTYLVRAPKDGGDRLVADLAKVGFASPVAVEGLPPTVFAEFKSTPDGYAVHLLNYDPSSPAAGGVLKLPPGCSVVFREPFGRDSGGVALSCQGGVCRLPEFHLYALIEVSQTRQTN